MTGTRVYVFIGEPDLRRWSRRQDVTLTGRPAHAVTPQVRQAFPDDDEEELEYAALWSAAERGAHEAGTVTVVAALDLPAAQAFPSGTDDPDRGFEVSVSEPVPVSRLVALHVLAADAGEDEELSWYDAGELDQVLELLG